MVTRQTPRGRDKSFRNKRLQTYSNGMYELQITVDKPNGMNQLQTIKKMRGEGVPLCEVLLQELIVRVNEVMGRPVKDQPALV